MSTIQLRNINTGKVIASTLCSSLTTAAQKEQISRQLIQDNNVDRRDVYLCEMAACCCINKWQIN